MKRLNLIVGLFDWVNTIISIYLLWKIIFDSPNICVNYFDTSMTIMAMLVLFGARMINEILNYIEVK